MKTIFSAQWIRKAVTALALVGVCAFSFAFVPSAVHAQDTGPGSPQVTPAAPGGGQKGKQPAKVADPAQAFKRLQVALKQQDYLLARAAGAGDKAAGLIEKVKAAGKDTAALETALSDYRALLTTAQTAYDKAEAAITAHNGFDAAGKVTDETAARETLQSAGKSLQDVRVTLKKAGSDLRAAARAWREANPRVEPAPQS